MHELMIVTDIGSSSDGFLWFIKLSLLKKFSKKTYCQQLNLTSPKYNLPFDAHAVNFQINQITNPM